MTPLSKTQAFVLGVAVVAAAHAPHEQPRSDDRPDDPIDRAPAVSPITDIQTSAPQSFVSDDIDSGYWITYLLASSRRTR